MTCVVPWKSCQGLIGAGKLVPKCFIEFRSMAFGPRVASAGARRANSTLCRPDIVWKAVEHHHETQSVMRIDKNNVL